MNKLQSLVLAALTIGLASVAGSAEPPKLMVYPAKGQSAEQQAKDESECHAWAIKETGIDPAAPPPAPDAQQASAPEEKKRGQRARGAARGAAAGAVVGEVANDDADEGAAVGAAAGAIAGGRQARKDEAAAKEQAAAEQKKAEEEAAAKQAEQMATFNRGKAACLEGRGYSIK
jgi:uncharacterized protein YcfJ